MSVQTIKVLGVGFGVTLLLIPLFAWVSQRIGLVDHPNARKIHDRPVPLVGGLAIYCGVVAAVMVGGFFNRQVFDLLLATFVVIALGVLDDRLDLRSTVRLCVQVLLALLLC